jgi:hypothetical protein
MKVSGLGIAGILLGGCVFVGVVVASSISAGAQTVNSGNASNNAVYSGSSTISPSSAFIDASVLDSTGDLCGKINAALTLLNSSPYSGAGVIDARGTKPGGSNSCSASPWAGFTSANAPSAVILLPAGTITLSSGANWVLPTGTRIVGEGPGASGTGSPASSPSVTTITAGSSFSGSMIQMGSSSLCPGSPAICFGVSVEDLSLNGNGESGVVGIENDVSQERSYVSRVSMYGMAGTGLKIGSAAQSGSGCCQAQNSGPYSNIYYESSGTSGTCANILGQGDLRGIHGITCIGNGSSVGIYLDSSNVTIEDAHLDGFTTGILIGSNTTSTTANPVRSNVLLNISGSVDTGSMTYLIDISNANSSNTMDVTVLGATSFHDSSGNPSNTIYDQLTGTTLAYSSDSHVGMYVLGESIGGGYSRFSTSATYPTWGVGKASSISGSCTSVGSLFSNISGTSSGNNNLYACVPTSTTANGWKAIH